MLLFDIEDFEKELPEFGEKLNKIMEESTKGKVDQVFKVCLMKIIVDSCVMGFKDANSKGFDDAYELTLKWIEQSGTQIKLKKREKKGLGI